MLHFVEANKSKCILDYIHENQIISHDPFRSSYSLLKLNNVNKWFCRGIHFQTQNYLDSKRYIKSTMPDKQLA